MTGEIAGRRRGGRRQPSMADVAARAGVSPITVSRVANGSPAVLEETRERVLAAMAELGYRPNKAARALNISPRQMGYALQKFNIEVKKF